MGKQKLGMASFALLASLALAACDEVVAASDSAADANRLDSSVQADASSATDGASAFDAGSDSGLDSEPDGDAVEEGFDAGFDAGIMDAGLVRDTGVRDTGVVVRDSSVPDTSVNPTTCSHIPEACVRLDCASQNDETDTWVCFQRYRRGAPRDSDFECGMVDRRSSRAPRLGAQYNPRSSNLIDPSSRNFQYNCGGSGQDYYGVISWCGTEIYTGPTLIQCRPNQATEI